jgi:tripartite ATP-independent transporter DctM subunit
MEISTLLAFFTASVLFIFVAFASGEKIGFLNLRIVISIIPVCFFAMFIRQIISLFKTGTKLSRKAACITVLAGCLLGLLFSTLSVATHADFDTINPAVKKIVEFSTVAASYIKIPAIILFVVSAILGTPIYIALGGITYILISLFSGGYVEVAINEIYVVLTDNTIPAIPLFTITGFILSESQAGKRLVNFFKETFGWFPGGIFIAAIMICAFFTTFTGASGVTILALGGLLYAILENYGVDKKFITGILTSSGSIGLMFPPSLPIILYGITAGIDIKSLFIAGFVPGIFLVFFLSLSGIFYSHKNKLKREKINITGLLKSIGNCYWELLLPLVIILSFFFGGATIIETGAVGVLYIFIVEVFIRKEIDFNKLIVIVKKSVPIIGGILIILGMSKAFSFYMIDEMIPQRFSEWVSARIASKIIFLLLLNAMLLIVGCIMDIFSAIVVIVPLIAPLGDVYGVNPVHLGIIFLANLELGYLTPPVGLNLFLASYRFEQPLEKVYTSVLPFFLILFVVVLIITFVPQISLLLV